MKEIQLRTISVQDIVANRYRFLIPSYQRGYRWGTDEVTALLNDLAEFEINPRQGQFYCLQPLVVHQQEGGFWEVVDGQQRLTTIFLILRYREKERFQIHYARHPRCSSGLDDLLKSPVGEGARFDSPDIYYIRKAEEAIKEWFNQHPEKRLTSLTSLDSAAKFIWHEIGNHLEGMRAFIRLNAGKIRLKDSELIRALFLRTASDADVTRHRIALRWDYMERRLHDPEFWAFLNKEGAAQEIRVEFLFQLIAMPNGQAAPKDREIFEYFFKKLADSNGRDQRECLWQEVEDLFSTLEEWFEDNRLFHLIGFLIGHNTSVATLRLRAEELGRKAFRKDLKQQIRSKVVGQCADSSAVESYLARVEYNDADRSKIKSILLCLNLATLDANSSGTVRFSFQAYRDQETHWDIEHIRATASRPPQGRHELLAVVKATRDYLQRTVTAPDQDVQDLLDADLESQTVENLQRLEKLHARVCNNMEGAEDLGASNGLGNLTLLDAGTNRGYGNSPFAVKRSWILGLDQQAKYLLPCTRNVFTKSYSLAPVNLLNWTKEDAQDYLSAITRTMTEFFNDTW